jgi:hypothetical protein
MGVFRAEVAFQCKAILSARAEVDRLLGIKRSTASDILIAVQNLVIAAGNTSKLLWGQRGIQRRRVRAPLRASLGVTNKSPLKKRFLRNDLEHIDERIEDWAKELARSNSTRIYVGRSVLGGSLIIGDDPRRRFPWYNPTTGVASFWQTSVSLPDLRVEAGRILALIDSQPWPP